MPDPNAPARNLTWTTSPIPDGTRALVNTGRGAVVWLTGLSGSGKSTLAGLLAHELTVTWGRAAYVLDGDNVRHGLCSDLGFAPAQRRENVRRVAAVAALMADAGLVAIAALISPYERDRAAAREAARGRFVEAHVSAPLNVCEARDPKGLYARARSGSIADFTGISAPYEAPKKPEVVIDTANTTPRRGVEQLQHALARVLGHGA